jgi:hypothetical protein
VGTLLNLAQLDAARGNSVSALDLRNQAVAMLEESQDNGLLSRARDFVSGLSRQAGESQNIRPIDARPWRVQFTEFFTIPGAAQ